MLFSVNFIVGHRLTTKVLIGKLPASPIILTMNTEVYINLKKGLAGQTKPLVKLSDQHCLNFIAFFASSSIKVAYRIFFWRGEKNFVQSTQKFYPLLLKIHISHWNFSTTVSQFMCTVTKISVILLLYNKSYMYTLTQAGGIPVRPSVFIPGTSLTARGEPACVTSAVSWTSLSYFTSMK